MKEDSGLPRDSQIVRTSCTPFVDLQAFRENIILRVASYVLILSINLFNRGNMNGMVGYIQPTGLNKSYGSDIYCIKIEENFRLDIYKIF